MNIEFDLREYLVKSIPVLITLFSVTLLIVSFGRVARWDLLDQVAMADNFLVNGAFYADPKLNTLHGQSVYFPGVAYIAIGLKLCGIEYYLVEVLLCIAVIVLLLFGHVLSMYASSYSSWIYPPRYFYPGFIVFLTIIVKNYTLYATEFKPDTIALLFGFYGLFLLYHKEASSKNFCFGVFLISSAVIFKQQYIAFLIGMFLSVLYVGRLYFRLAVVVICTFSSIAVINLTKDSKSRFWTLDVLADDGFQSLNNILYESILLIISIVLIILIRGAIQKNNLFIYKSIKINRGILKLIGSNPWYMITALIGCVCVLGFLKEGGNSGNIELFLVVLFPMIGFFAKSISNWRLIIIAWLGLLTFVQGELDSLKQYKSALELKEQVNANRSLNDDNILTGSNVYYASRVLLREGVILENYWTKALRNGTPVYSQLQEELNNKSYDFLVVENFGDNLKYLESSNNYDVLFVNGLGIIARNR